MNYFYQGSAYKAKMRYAVILLLFFSCKQSDRRGNPPPHTTTEKSYKARLHLQPGARYYYTIYSETNTFFELANNEIENINDAEAGLRYEVIKDTADGYLLKMTYDHIHVKLKTNESEQELDTNKEMDYTDPIAKMLALLKGSSILVTIDHKGAVTSLKGYKELADKITSGITVQSEADRAKMKEQLSSMLGETFVKNSMEQGFGLLPDTAVYPGDSWTKKNVEVNTLQMNVTSVCTLSSVDDHIAAIKINSVIDDNDSSVNLMGMQVAVRLRGNQEGDYKMDITTGLLTKGNAALTLKGTVQTVLKEVPLTIKMKRKLTLKQI